MKKVAGIIGILFACGFLVLALTIKIPDKYISSWGSGKMTEYVGGDAYNYIIEASLRGGEISAAYTQRAIYFSIAAVLFVISLSFFADPTKHIVDTLNDISITQQRTLPEQQDNNNEPGNISDD